MFDLKDKIALVTGGSRGIGRGIALALAKQGANVAVNYNSNVQEAEKVVEEIKALGRDAFAVQADVSKADQVQRMYAEVMAKWGKLDILANNAGVAPAMTPIDQTTEEQWDSVVDINLKGQFLCAREASKVMKSGGRIINTASIASGGVGGGFGGMASYVASKGGVVGLTEDLAVDFAPKGININAVAPGVIETDMTKPFISNPEMEKGFMSHIPKGRFGKPEDIGAAVAFLASDEADYITGAVLYVDGGWLAA
ncbi:MAG: 3-oxoacyl-ACP reductase family protein [bacterium]|nr:3-oxoacyl-ACP reductase family protein [bacterium]